VTSPLRTTVAIPLHASRPWVDIVEGNLRRLAGHAHLVVSDASGVDDALDVLRERCRDLPGIVWRTTPGEVGWVAHCNTLLAEATTEFVMWLPHDDDVGHDWILQAESALDADPTAVLAIGVMDTLGPGDPSWVVEIDRRTRHQSRDVRIAAVADIWVDGDLSSLGLAFRGVFRRAVAPRLPQLDEVGTWADLLWAGEFLTRGRFARMGARYLKRYHPGNTHSAWVRLREDSRLRTELLPRLVAQLPPETATRVLGAVWERERENHLTHVAVLTELDRARTDTLSWRITAPLRAVRRRFRRAD
jgi:hypothetical protein